MTIKSPELLEKTRQDISTLRESLKNLENAHPELFVRYEEKITSEWEFWTTDEILEHIGDEISSLLITNGRQHD